jgi:hypothetical protein
MMPWWIFLYILYTHTHMHTDTHTWNKCLGINLLDQQTYALILVDIAKCLQKCLINLYFLLKCRRLLSFYTYSPQRIFTATNLKTNLCLLWESWASFFILKTHFKGTSTTLIDLHLCVYYGNFLVTFCSVIRLMLLEYFCCILYSNIYFIVYLFQNTLIL